MNDSNVKKHINILVRQTWNEPANIDFYDYVKTLKGNFKNNTLTQESLKPVSRIVLYKKKGCVPCQKLKPLWDKLVKENPEIIFEELEKTHTDGIPTYPTIKKYTKDGNVFQFTQSRTYENLLAFVRL